MKTSTYIKKGTVALAIFTITLLFSMFIFFDQAFSITEESKLDLPEVDKSIQSELPAGKYYISTSYNLFKLIDITACSLANGANVEIWNSNLTNAQKFEVVYDQKGYATIINSSGKVLDIEGGYCRSGDNVVQWENKNSVNQKWIISKVGQYYKITSAFSKINGKNICLDVYGHYQTDGANVQVYEDNNGDNQIFTFTNIDSNKLIGDQVIPDGNYTVRMSTSKNMCLDVPKNSLENDTQLDLWSYNGGENQVFNFSFDQKTMCYKIFSVASGKVLDASGRNPFPLTSVVQYDYNGDDNQLWALSKNQDGSITIKNRHTALSLDVYGGVIKEGSLIDTNTSNGMKSQKFSLEEAPLIAEGLQTLISKVYDDRYVDNAKFSWAEGNQFIVYSGTTGYNQKYMVKMVDKNVYTFRSLASGMYISRNKSNVVQSSVLDDNAKWRAEWSTNGLCLVNLSSGQYMTVENSSTTPGAKLILATKKNTRSQAFYCKITDFASSMTYTLSTECSINNCLNIDGNSWRQGRKLIMWNGLKDNNSKWRIESCGNNQYRLVSSMTDYVVDANNHGRYDNDIVQQYSWNGGKNQLWKVEFTDDGWFNFVCVESGRLLTNLDKSSKIGSSVGVYHRDGTTSQNWKFRSADPASFSGNVELDAHLKNICRSYPDLPSVYNFISGFAYRDGDLWPGGDWTIPYALEMIYNGSGNCYRYAALFLWCARALGYSANAICGELATTGGGRQAHGWVEVYSGGTYVCDPELQHVLWQYNFYMITYDTAPVIYYK